MRASFFVAISALFAGAAYATASAPAEYPPVEQSLVKRTGGGSYYGCSNPFAKLVHSGNKCSCKNECGKTEKHCKGPKTPGTGDAVCTPSGCAIDCHYGMKLTKNGDDCTCQSGYKLSSTKKYCEPKCTEHETWNGSKCVCKPDCGLVKGVCQPTCPANSHWCTACKICKCDDGFYDNGKKCKPIPTCPIGSEWCSETNQCKCKPGYNKDGQGNCVKCGDHMSWDWHKKQCVCKPGCHPDGDHCSPGPSQGPKKHKAYRREAPVWSPKLHTRDQDSLFCPNGHSACPIPSSLGGYECVDTQQELENCGGCVSDGQGQDCTAIAGVSGVGCRSGVCVIFSCAEGFHLTSAGECAPFLTTQKKHKRSLH